MEMPKESLGWRETIFWRFLQAILGMECISCAFTEFNAFRWKTISPRQTLMATTIFYPGVYFAARGIRSWADNAVERQKRRREEAISSARNGPYRTRAHGDSLPKSSRDIGLMDPRMSPIWIAMLGMNLRGRFVERSLRTCYEVWSPHFRAGIRMHDQLRPTQKATPLMGLGAIVACHTLWKWNKEASRNVERPL